MAVPSWIRSERQKEWWRKPWTVPLPSREGRDFKAKLWEHGFLSPNFRRTEAHSKGGDSCGCPAAQVPEGSPRARAQYHAFCLERVRHLIGDKGMNPLSWGRSDCHNRCVGGVGNSEHKNWWATDWSDAERVRLGSSQFNSAMNSVFRNGGRGYYRGNIRHVDNGNARTWTY